MSELLKPVDAAKLAGVSYPTLKQWIYKGKIHTTKTAGGHHRIARSEIERVTEAFNVTNTPPLGAPNAALASPGFGSITSAGDPRVIQLGIKLNF